MRHPQLPAVLLSPHQLAAGRGSMHIRAEACTSGHRKNTFWLSFDLMHSLLPAGLCLLVCWSSG